MVQFTSSLKFKCLMVRLLNKVTGARFESLAKPSSTPVAPAVLAFLLHLKEQVGEEHGKPEVEN